MSRNKYPEETVQKIIDVSYRLFMQKGYEQTSIQDIVNELGMSKGAIYYHFKNKEEILDKVSDQIYDQTINMSELREDATLTGLEKIRKIFILSLSNERKMKLDHTFLPLSRNPKLIIANLNGTVYSTAPMLAEFIHQGNQDGSLYVADVKNTSEVLMILINIWISPGMFMVEREEFIQKVAFLKQLIISMGIPLFDDELFQVCIQYYDSIVQHL